MKELQESLQQSDETSGNNRRPLTRRRFVQLGAAAAVAGLLPPSIFASKKDIGTREKFLAFYHTHTGEQLKTVYWAEGRYVQESLHEINYILRDARNDETHEIDTRLLDLLFAIAQKIDARQSFHVISGYRSAHTNALLRARSTGVAENSLHLVGQAIDIRLPGRPLGDLRRAALALKSGGVGFYPKSDFVHVDVGRPRHW
jgi:uncharacterized protein YcbK (DUF882 family)